MCFRSSPEKVTNAVMTVDKTKVYTNVTGKFDTVSSIRPNNLFYFDKNILSSKFPNAIYLIAISTYYIF